MLNRISVQLPVDGLLFWKLSGHEALSQNFALSLVVLSTDARIDRGTLLGQPVTITIPTKDLLKPRYFNGKITGIAVSAVELSGSRYAAYTLSVESDLWPMQRDRNLRIFQEQTVPQIIKTLFAEYHVNVTDALVDNYRSWDYCVQYQESSFDFISRLMELEGISYYFKHEKDRHTLVLVDTAEHYQPTEGYEIIPYQHTFSGGSTMTEGIAQWAIGEVVTPGLYSLDDYDFRKPNAWLHQARQNPASPQPGKIDVYEWPGRFVEHSHGEAYARIRQQRWQVEHQRINGTATAIGIAPGKTFVLNNAPFFSDNGEYLTTEAHYQFEENRYASGDDNNTIHKIDFSVIPSKVIFRPAQKIPWPRTYGPQTAKVVGPQGETIWTDRYGRIKVKFHWDRYGKGDDTSSCWVRVSSAWAGQGFGGVQIPRVNDEVVIDFINGDPDRPIVTGRVYNESRMPPWELPNDATRMGFMTRSKDGNKDNASYLFFEDRAGSETVDLHSERDMNISVENDKAINIDGHRLTKIGKTQSDEVVGDASFYYQAKRTTIVDKEETATFNQGQATLISNGRKLKITDGGDVSNIIGNVATLIEGSVDTTIKSGWNYLTLEDGSMWVKISTGGRRVEIQDGDELVVHNGGRKNTVKGGVDTTITGDWTQKVTKGNITISTPDTITIKGDTKVDIQSPDWFEFKGVSVGVKINETSFGLTEIASRAFKYETNPIQIKIRGGGARFEMLGTKIEKDLLSIKTAVLNIIT
ncbi:type VI secretion system tip protein VgrG [Cronobacter turicensis]|nr:type VI secretion system tip protein VgrG [Cronobacter turicensis]ELY3626743.1 type VI secretion system tip protein VgrG [Cronobacter turicensis]CCJ91493.1 VgrG protein [Cronobacter turicensis 564]